MARIGAGRRNRKVAFYPITVTTDGLGTESEVSGTAIPAWANVRFGSGDDRREAAQGGSQQTATFRVLSSTSLRGATERWEIEYSGARWGITSIVPIDNEANEIEFTAIRKGA